MNNSFFQESNFLGLPPELANEENARVGILPVPYDATVSYVPGTRNGPSAIIEASKNVEWYDPLTEKESCRTGIHTYPFLEPLLSPVKMMNRITRVVETILSKELFPVILGGEHSISYGVVRALKQQWDELTVLQLDAHADLRDTYAGSPYNHACVMRRICAEVPHAGLGIRSMSLEEAQWIDEHDITCLSPDATADRNSVTSALEKVLHDPVYITVDLDAFDPSIMPAVGTPEPGGLQWQETIWILS